MARYSKFPWKLPAPENADIYAIQALARGIANQAQQLHAWDYIVHNLCEADRMTFMPGGGEEGNRVTSFAEGKRWVGIQLRRLVSLRPKMEGLFGNAPSSEENPPE